MLTLLALLSLAAPREFEVTVTPAQGAAELDRRARIRCGGDADAVRPPTDAGVGVFTCHEQPGVDVTDSLREAELVVRGKVTRIEAPPAAQFGDPAPQWRRATVKVQRLLKGVSTAQSVKFLFIDSKEEGYAAAPKVKVGQEGLWLLTRGLGALRDLTMTSSLDDHPADAEEFLAELVAQTACPAKPEGTCDHPSWLCPSAAVTCTCEAACGGGARRPANYVAPLRWVCRPAACRTAKAGAPCATGLACEGCWGTHPVTCEKGRWKFHRISPPP